MKPTDVLVAGSGMAGMVAALAVAAGGKSVRLVARGAGALAVGGGQVDLLGYTASGIVRGNPLDAIDTLPESHPYILIGRQGVQDALDFFRNICVRHGLAIPANPGKNQWVPTILGTFKPTFFCPERSDREALQEADALLVPRFSWLKDCHAGLACRELGRQKRLKHLPMDTPALNPPLGPTHRNLTALDTARLVETPAGMQWLQGELAAILAPYRGRKAAVLVPPVLGVGNSAAIRKTLEERLGCLLVEMLAPPPAVSGLRVRGALKAALAQAGVLLSENTRITGARLEGQRCAALVASGPDRQREIGARAFIIATGGFFGGGHCTGPGTAAEGIFGLSLGAPAAVQDWSAPDIFALQPFATLGVRVDARMAPLAPLGGPLLDNVFFAGRALAGYDFVLEKSGHGVAIASACRAARSCLELPCLNPDTPLPLQEHDR